MKPRLIVLISGGGSNLQALMEAIATKQLNAEIVLVVSNRKAAYGLERAKNAGIATLYFPLKPYKDSGRSREEYDTDLTRELEQYNPELLILAGWMHVDSGVMCRRFAGRMINLHPALPGAFAGAHGIEDTFAAWQRGEVSSGGCMVHEVIPELDAGAPIVVREISLLPDDTLESYKARVHKAEHEIIVEATKKMLNGWRIRCHKIEDYLINNGDKYVKQLARDSRLHIKSMLEVGEEQIALESFIHSIATEKINIEIVDIQEIYDLCLLAELNTEEAQVIVAWDKFFHYLKTLGFNPKTH
jgi:formyltetrahydrofolate-dependent phosphoribosylglycinamide formyltransferase